MPIGRPKTALVLSEDERIQVSSLTKSRTLPHAIVARAKVVLWAAEGDSNTEIANRLQWTNATVGKWRRRFIEPRLPGLYDELRPGRPRSIEDEQVAALLKRTLSRKICFTLGSPLRPITSSTLSPRAPQEASWPTQRFSSLYALLPARKFCGRDATPF